MPTESPGRASGRAVESLRRPFVWRGLAFTAVLVLGVVGLSVGVGVTERDLSGAGLAERAYYALGLFVLGGLDIGTPTGGPRWGRALLWIAFFGAPVITASAIVETALRLIGPLALRVRRLSNHVVLGGAGRLTLLYVRKLRARSRRRGVVVVERDANHPLLHELRERHGAVVVIGDIASDPVLQGLRLDRAHRALFLTGDDFANLDAAAKTLRLAPALTGRIVAHVSDLRFMRETAGSSVARECEIFNGHEFAAVNLVREHLLARFQSTAYRDLVVLAGFGRFGQTVLHQLQQHAPGSFGHVVIIDEVAVRNARIFADEPGFTGDYERTILDGDLRDPEIWARVGEVVEREGHDPVVISGSGNDGTNLQVGHAVRRRHPGAYVIVRSFRSSPFTSEVARESGMSAFNLAQLIENGMPEAWF